MLRKYLERWLVQELSIGLWNFDKGETVLLPATSAGASPRRKLMQLRALLRDAVGDRNVEGPVAKQKAPSQQFPGDELLVPQMPDGRPLIAHHPDLSQMYGPVALFYRGIARELHQQRGDTKRSLDQFAYTNEQEYRERQLLECFAKISDHDETIAGGRKMRDAAPRIKPLHIIGAVKAFVTLLESMIPPLDPKTWKAYAAKLRTIAEKFSLLPGFGTHLVWQQFVVGVQNRAAVSDNTTKEYGARRVIEFAEEQLDHRWLQLDGKFHKPLDVGGEGECFFLSFAYAARADLRGSIATVGGPDDETWRIADVMRDEILDFMDAPDGGLAQREFFRDEVLSSLLEEAGREPLVGNPEKNILGDMLEFEKADFKRAAQYTVNDKYLLKVGRYWKSDKEWPNRVDEEQTAAVARMNDFYAFWLQFMRRSVHRMHYPTEELVERVRSSGEALKFYRYQRPSERVPAMDSEEFTEGVLKWYLRTSTDVFGRVGWASRPVVMAAALMKYGTRINIYKKKADGNYERMEMHGALGSPTWVAIYYDMATRHYKPMVANNFGNAAGSAAVNDAPSNPGQPIYRKERPPKHPNLVTTNERDTEQARKNVAIAEQRRLAEKAADDKRRRDAAEALAAAGRKTIQEEEASERALEKAKAEADANKEAADNTAREQKALEEAQAAALKQYLERLALKRQEAEEGQRRKEASEKWSRTQNDRNAQQKAAIDTNRLALEDQQKARRKADRDARVAKLRAIEDARRRKERDEIIAEERARDALLRQQQEQQANRPAPPVPQDPTLPPPRPQYAPPDDPPPPSPAPSPGGDGDELTEREQKLKEAGVPQPCWAPDAEMTELRSELCEEYASMKEVT